MSNRMARSIGSLWLASQSSPPVAQSLEMLVKIQLDCSALPCLIIQLPLLLLREIMIANHT